VENIRKEEKIIAHEMLTLIHVVKGKTYMLKNSNT
jgi:hypothetical protein